jgi:hypothetical protein
MGTTTFYVLLVAGGLVTGLLARLVPTGRGRLPLPVALIVAPVGAVIAGGFASDWFDAHDARGVLAGLGLALVFVVVMGRSNGDSDGSGWSWGGGDGDGGSCGSCGGGD